MSLTVVAGGLGAVGRMLHRELGGDLGRIVDIDPRRGIGAGDITALDPVECDLLRNASTVVLAVPGPVALAALPSVTQLLRADALLVETLSVKSRIAEAIAREDLPFEVVGVNPMFGPSLGMAGRAVAVVPYLAGERTSWFTSLIVARGAQIVELSSETHDRTAAALQALPHVLILAFARVLADCELDVESALRIAPPPARAILALAARMAGGNPEVYGEIQAANPFAQAARESLDRAVAEVMEACIDTDALGGLLAAVRFELGDSHSGLLRAAERLVCEQQLRVELQAAGAVRPR